MGFVFVNKRFITGLSYRKSDAINGVLGLKTKYINVIYSYDYTTSKLQSDTGGSHEVSLQFNPFKKKKKSHKNLVVVQSAFML